MCQFFLLSLWGPRGHVGIFLCWLAGDPWQSQLPEYWTAQQSWRSGSAAPQLVSCWSQKDSLCTLSPPLACSQGRKALTHLFTPPQTSECQSREPRAQHVGRPTLSVRSSLDFRKSLCFWPPLLGLGLWSRALSAPRGGKLLCQLPPSGPGRCTRSCFCPKPQSCLLNKGSGAGFKWKDVLNHLPRILRGNFTIFQKAKHTTSHFTDHNAGELDFINLKSQRVKPRPHLQQNSYRHKYPESTLLTVSSLVKEKIKIQIINYF